MLTLILDFRRLIRPFFLTPSGAPTSYKPLYDVLSYLSTQLAFAFAAAPFVLLTLPTSFKVWSRVYFYTPIGIALSMAFFASPAKPYLANMLERRNKKTTTREGKPVTANVKMLPTNHADMRKEPVMGLSSDPGSEIDQAIREMK